MRIAAVEIVEVVGPSWDEGRTGVLYVQVHTDEGPSGLFGPVQPPQADVIRRFLAPFLVGKDPLATEALHDEMLRLDRHGRTGLFLTGLSPVDCALWDLKGKVLDLPVWRLLGGPTRPSVPAYASMLGNSVDPDAAVAVAVEHAGLGYEAQKWFFEYGPEHGQKAWPRTSTWPSRCATRSGPTTASCSTPSTNGPPTTPSPWCASSPPLHRPG